MDILLCASAFPRAMLLNRTLLIVVPPERPDFAAPEHGWKRAA
jgi:hypothetical protein